MYCANVNFSVIGCGDMSPPEGAWMTRDGDVIEIGCHSGSKTWTLRCDENKWVGVLGYCGHQDSGKSPSGSDKVAADDQTSLWSISPGAKLLAFRFSLITNLK